MRDADIRSRANDDLADIASALTHLPNVFANLDLWTGRGYPTASGTGSRSGTADPTAAAALNPDRTKHWKRVRADYLAAWKQLDDATRVLHDITESVRTVRGARAGQPPGAVGCVSCSRVLDANGDPMWTKLSNTTTRLCRWCSDFTERWKVLPAPALVAEHAHTLRNVTSKRVVEVMPDLAARAAELDEQTKRKRTA